MLPGFCCRVLVLLGSVLLVTPLEPLFPGPCGLDDICQGAKTVRRGPNGFAILREKG